mmetsp:Transcript_77043/g.160328  ORF Transcript_77043/g.160328 Transcript_77043/m.160328 type:complete len:339 (+) Transcript_77043:213-1229(+)|eukprot:CAMPEP_0206467336 /NCGR_PEP_ID=MMETSP0324_2-20121206/28978_1 /ASSEMBLY_ACC=CAM_ASM_000836 /TAXON_ID=2866 /ORGANISM="Crypthecodinium cohnii, Strain Seligo" /LENGTH=338 /DNA_ID=CAMNT_0053940593 /DNA_START=143 /DNA_END=1159 /DNA_ORIENTATION=-
MSVDPINTAFLLDDEANSVVATVLPFGAAEAFFCIVIALVVLPLEVQRRGGGGSLASLEVSRYADNAKRFLKECAPEALMLLSFATLAALLRSRGDESMVLDDRASEEAWAQIKAEWPLLLTADTLLSLQAMIRVIVLLSAVCRKTSCSHSALSGESAIFALIAGLARVGLFYRSSAYMLDGPLGGWLPGVCEAVVVPLLLILAWKTIRARFLWVVLAVLGICFHSLRNRLALAEDNDYVADSLFIAAHCGDLMAAVAFLGRSALVEGANEGVSAGFAQLLMPLQQGFAAYYFLQAFSHSEELVGTGRPFDVLHIGSTIAFGAYLGGCALYLAERFDS